MESQEFFSWFWWCLGAICIIAEFLIPGLVIMFVGLGALTVGALRYYQVIDSVTAQFLVWFVSTLVYCFTLRLLVIRFYPSDRVKREIRDQEIDQNTECDVVITIPKGGIGRIRHEGATWNARAESEAIQIEEGSKVRIISRDNLTYIVSKI